MLGFGDDAGVAVERPQPHLPRASQKLKSGQKRHGSSASRGSIDNSRGRKRGGTSHGKRSQSKTNAIRPSGSSRPAVVAWENMPALPKTRSQLPISSCRHEIVSAVRQHAALVVAGETGSGKSTQLPQYLLEDGASTEGWAWGGKAPSAQGAKGGAEDQRSARLRPMLIAVTQPRRVAAITVAARVGWEISRTRDWRKARRAAGAAHDAEKRDSGKGSGGQPAAQSSSADRVEKAPASKASPSKPGRSKSASKARAAAAGEGVFLGDVPTTSPHEAVSHAVRFDDRTSGKTRVRFCTDGLLLREAQSDPLFRRYSVVVVDEAHERSAASDVLLGMLLLAARQRCSGRGAWVADRVRTPRGELSGAPPAPSAPSLASSAAPDGGNPPRRRVPMGPADLQARQAFCVGRTPSDEGADRLPEGYEWRQLPPLRVVIMSATLDAGVFLRFLGPLRLPLPLWPAVRAGCKRLRPPLRTKGGAAKAAAGATEGEGEAPPVPRLLVVPSRQHPVKVLYLERPCRDYVREAVRSAVAMHVRMWRAESAGEAGAGAASSAGDRQSLLVFLPGQDEIREARAALEEAGAATCAEWQGLGASGGGGAAAGSKRKRGGDSGPQDTTEAGDDAEELKIPVGCPLPVPVPLFAALPPAQQLLAFKPLVKPPEQAPQSAIQYAAELQELEKEAGRTLAGVRKVVLATTIAETSVTIDGVRAVVDAGVTKLRDRDPTQPGVASLLPRPESKAQARQRAGRAGRTGPGVCVRLYPEACYGMLPGFQPCEALRAPLAGLLLRLVASGVPASHVLAFPWVEAPPGDAVEEGLWELARLGALGDTGEGAGADGKIADEKAQDGAWNPRLLPLLRRADDEQPSTDDAAPQTAKADTTGGSKGGKDRKPGSRPCPSPAGPLEQPWAGCLSAKGRLMARLPLDPPLAGMLLTFAEVGATAEGAAIVAILSADTPVFRQLDTVTDARARAVAARQAGFRVPSSDHLTYLRAFGAFLLADARARRGDSGAGAGAGAGAGGGEGMGRGEKKRKMAQLRAAMGQSAFDDDSGRGGGRAKQAAAPKAGGGKRLGGAGTWSRGKGKGKGGSHPSAWTKVVSWCDRHGLSARAMRSAQRVYGQVLGLCREASIGTVESGAAAEVAGVSAGGGGGTEGGEAARCRVSCVGLLPTGAVAEDGQLLPEAGAGGEGGFSASRPGRPPQAAPVHVVAIGLAAAREMELSGREDVAGGGGSAGAATLSSGVGGGGDGAVHRTAVGLLRMALLAGSPLTQARRVGAGRGDSDAAEQMLAGGGGAASEQGVGSSQAAAGFSTAQSSVSFVVRRSGVEARVHSSSAVAAGVEAALEQLKRAEALARKGKADARVQMDGSSSAGGTADETKPVRSPAPDTVVYHEVHRTRRVYLRCCTGIWDDEARAWKGLLKALSEQ